MMRAAHARTRRAQPSAMFASRPSRRTVRSLPRVPPARFLRVFLLATLAVAASGYAVVRHLTRVKQPLTRPVPALDAGEIPAPELLPLEALSSSGERQ